MTRNLVYGALALSVAGAAALLITGTVTLPFAGHSGAAAGRSTSIEASAQPVTVTRVLRADFIETVLLTGTLVAREEILVSPELDGFKIITLGAEVGDTVKEGQVLAELVSDQLDAHMAQNRAALAKADAAIAQAGSQIAEAEATLAQSRADFKRAAILKRKGHVSASVYDQRQAAKRTAKARLAVARDGLRLAQAEKAHIKAQRQELQWRIGNTKVRALAGGIVSQRTARRGALASANAAPLFRIIENGEIELDAEVPVADLPKLKVGQIAGVMIAGLGEQKGTVRLIAPAVDKASRLGRVRIFLGANRDLHIGSFGRGVVETAKARGLAVPLSSVLYGAGGAQVQVVTNDRVETRTVATGLTSGKFIEIVKGLADGDLVITRAGTFLRDGDLVRPIASARALAGDAASLSGTN